MQAHQNKVERQFFFLMLTSEGKTTSFSRSIPNQKKNKKRLNHLFSLSFERRSHEELNPAQNKCMRWESLSKHTQNIHTEPLPCQSNVPSKLAGRRKCGRKPRQEKLQPSEAKCRDGGGFTETESGEPPQARNELQLQQ